MPDSQKISEKQSEYMNLIAEIMDIRKRGEKPVAYIRTYGCQQNVADSEKIKGMLEQSGFEFADEPDNADFILFNTCAVREHAEDRVFGNVGALKSYKRENHDVVIALCGCMMQEEHVVETIRKKYRFVDLVFGTHNIYKFAELIVAAFESKGMIVDIWKDTDKIVEDLPVERKYTFKSGVNIMFGCNNFCSYCIVPYVRGRERSRDPKDIIREIERLVADGVVEVMLLGQNVNSYGKNLEHPMTFAQLLEEVEKIDGLERIRFMTSHPKDASKELFDVMAHSRHIPHYIHLPFQSGNDRVLREMNRKYDREKYLSLIRYAREVMPDISFTSDVIVGFPGETYAEFQDTLSLIREVEFTNLFTFIYSSREGTRAARMPDPVTYGEKTKWFAELLETQEEIAVRRSKRMVGTNERVLVEDRNQKSGLLSGRTGGSHTVEFSGEDALIGNFAEITVTDARGFQLHGELIR